MTSSKTQIERLATMEEQIKNISEDIKEIKSNHLPHIYGKLEDLEKFKIQVLTFAIIGSTIGSIFIQIILKFIK